MTTFIMIRHGESQANTDGRFAGWWDSPPTELGLLQAEKTAEYAVSAYPMDALYSSDLSRAMSVANAISKRTGMKVNPRKNLREICAGDWESKTFAELDEKFPAYQIWRTDVGNAVCDGGESVAQLQERILKALSELAEEHPGQTVVITTHATPIRVTQCACEGKTLSQLKDIPWVSNASVTVFTYDDGKLEEVVVGYDQHLGDLITRLPANV